MFDILHMTLQVRYEAIVCLYLYLCIVTMYVWKKMLLSYVLYLGLVISEFVNVTKY